MTAAHPIELGVVSAAIFPLALHRSLHAGRRLLPWAQTGMILVVLLMSVSRSAIVVLAVAMLVMIAGWPARWRLWALVVTPVAPWRSGPHCLDRWAPSALFTNLRTIPASPAELTTTRSSAGWSWSTRTSGRDCSPGCRSTRTIDNQALMFALELDWLVRRVRDHGRHPAGALLARTRIDDRRSRHLALAIVAAASGLLAAYVTFDAISFRMAAGMTFLLLGMAGRVGPDPAAAAGFGSAVPLDRADHRSA